MNILKLTPSCKDYLWGGSRLRSDFGIKSDLNPLAEAWVLSCHPDGPSYLADGTTLADYVTAHPGCLGTDCEKFEQFGRAIRTEQDSCVVAILDERAGIGGKYHDAALAALPSCPITEKIEDVQQFIREQKSPDYFL